MNTLSSCYLHGDHEGEECPLCQALGAIRAARVLIEATAERGPGMNCGELDVERVVALHGEAIEALQRVKPAPPRRPR